MTDRVRDLEALLVDAERAHGAYESAELNGIYDEQWPRWYAEYAVEHGIGALLGREVNADEVAAVLSAAWTDFERADPPPSDPWSTHTARRLSSALRAR